MKTMESITSFFKRAELLFRPASSFAGRLDQNLVQSAKPVIVFEYPRILQSSDTVEEATTFLLNEKQDGRARHAAIYRHDTDTWHKMDVDLIQSRLQVEENEDVAEQTTGEKVMESITSFFRRAEFELRRDRDSAGFSGRLDQSLVQSRKRVIVFEYPHILHATDNIEEATAFLQREQGAGRARRAAVYKHDTDSWCKMDTAARPASPSSPQPAPIPPKSAP
jgi:hypothetical protein